MLKLDTQGVAPCKTSVELTKPQYGATESQSYKATKTINDEQKIFFKEK